MAGSLFDKIKEKLPLDKLKNIKLDLPFVKKKKVEGAPAADADAPNKKQPDLKLTDKGTHLTDKTDPGVPAGDKTETEVSVDQIQEAEKKPSLLQTLRHTKLSPVKIIVLLCVVYLIYDTLLGEAPPEEAPLVERPVPKKKKKKKIVNPDAATATTTTAPGTEGLEPGTLPSPEAGGTPLPKESKDPVDNIDVAATPAATPTPVTEVSATPEPAASETPKPEGTAVSNLEDLNLDEINKEADKIEKQQDEKAAETPAPEPTSATPTLSDIAEDKSEEAKASTGEAKEKTDQAKGDIAEDLLNNLKDEEASSSSTSKAGEVKETTPPDYLRSGRGLVYNCKGKHWACVSKDQYAQCKSNRLWNTQNDKASECHDVSVYATEKDCSTAQKIKIEGLAKTNFCK